MDFDQVGHVFFFSLFEPGLVSSHTCCADFTIFSKRRVSCLKTVRLLVAGRRREHIPGLAFLHAPKYIDFAELWEVGNECLDEVV
jgi:hypothetical protein